MRQIEKQMLQAIANKQDFKKDNIEVKFSESKDVYIVKLFGNIIATYSLLGLQITTAGWPTRTTVSRLNALTYSKINIRKGVAYLDGEKMKRNKFYLVR
jgi:hypothetical protein